MHRTQYAISGLSLPLHSVIALPNLCVLHPSRQCSFAHRVFSLRPLCSWQNTVLGIPPFPSNPIYLIHSPLQLFPPVMLSSCLSLHQAISAPVLHGTSLKSLLAQAPSPFALFFSFYLVLPPSKLRLQFSTCAIARNFVGHYFLRPITEQTMYVCMYY